VVDIPDLLAGLMLMAMGKLQLHFVVANYRMITNQFEFLLVVELLLAQIQLMNTRRVRLS
jgi:hypothetical protein